MAREERPKVLSCLSALLMAKYWEKQLYSPPRQQSEAPGLAICASKACLVLGSQVFS